MLSDKKTEGELQKEKSIAFLKKKEVPYSKSAAVSGRLALDC